jgi:ribosomal protein S12 methylthiotransferase
MNKTIWIRSLGCPKNEVDGESMENLLLEKGYRITEDRNDADILILNTCGFIQPAKEESIGELFDLIALKDQNRKKKVIVCGCLAQRYPHELWSKLPELDAVLGVGEIDSIHSACSSVLQGKRVFSVGTPDRRESIKRTRRNPKGLPFAYIKIADGCDNRCSYCAIPAIRGGFRSKRFEHIMNETRQLVEQGVKEINLVGQDTTLYGVDLYGEKRLPQLLSSLSEIPKLEWIRLLYTHPAHYTDELIKQIASNPKICKYLDLPLQHISDDILGRMNRKVKRKEVEQLICKLRERVSGLTLRTSFIVGFPGEKKRHFDELLAFVEQVKFEKLGAFAYSREEGTKAYDFKAQVSSRIKQERLDRLMLAQQKIALDKNRDKIGKTLSVLVEGRWGRGNCRHIARSEGEAPEVDGVILLSGNHAKSGRFVKAKVVGYSDYDLLADMIPPGSARRRGWSGKQKASGHEDDK